MPSTKQAIELSIPQPDESIKIDADSWLARASAFEIGTAQDSANAQALRSAVNAEIKRLEAERMDITRPIDESKKKIMDLYAGPINVLKQALGLYGRLILEFNQRQDDIRAEQQRKLDAEAAAKRKALEEQAARAAAKGKLDKAELLEQRAATVVAPIVRTDAPKLAGTQFREVWKYRIRDASKINPAFLMPDETKIGAIVRSTKKDAEGIVGEGIEVYSEKIIASGRA